MTRTRTLLGSGALAALLLLVALPLRADTIYTNFPTGLQGNWWTVGNGYSPAMEFTAGGTGTLIDAVLEINGGTSGGSLTAYLEADSGGSPGAVLDTLTTSQNLPSYNAVAPITFTCSACSQIVFGTNYWLQLVDTVGNNIQGWVISNQVGSIYDGPGGYALPSNDLGAFEVDATPEPSTLLLLATGLLALGLFERRRRLAAN